MRIEIRTVSPGRMRYSTCGDWMWLPDGTLLIEVPENGSDDSSFLVALHGLVEAWTCRGLVREEDVTAWDVAHPELEDPGGSPEAPYYHQHQLSLRIERLVCESLGIAWQRHDDWVAVTVDEVARQADSATVPAIEVAGARLWAELHLYTLRGGRWNADWWQGWVDALPFDGCPCEEHFRAFREADPPESADDFFAWGIRLHNSVNARLGRPQLSPEQARHLWSRKSL